MSKNVIGLSRKLLAKFYAGEPPSTSKISSPPNLREELIVLKKIKAIKKWRVYNKIRAIHFYIDYKNHIAITANIDESYIDELFSETGGTIIYMDVPGSIYLYICNELNLNVLPRNQLNIENEIIAPSQTPEGVDLNVIKNFIEPICVFEIKPDSPFKPSTSEDYVSYYISTFLPEFNNSCLSKTSKNLARSLFLSQKDNLIENNILSALSCSIPKHAFLEIYRSLEFVFVLPRANALLKKLDSIGHRLGLDVMDFAKHCYSELGWKRIERDAIERLLIEYAENDSKAFVNLCENCIPLFDKKTIPRREDEEFKKTIKSIASIYYEVRNQVVHQFWPDEERDISSDEWEALIEFTLECLCYFYSNYPLNNKA